MQKRENETAKKQLCEEAVAAYDEREADPSRAIAADEVFAAVRARHREKRSRKA